MNMNMNMNMKLTSNGRAWDFDSKQTGGILLEMSSEGFNEVDASHLDPNHIDAYTKDPKSLGTEDLVAAFKVAHFLQASKTDAIGKELASRMSRCTYDDIRQISAYFDK